MLHAVRVFLAVALAAFFTFAHAVPCTMWKAVWSGYYGPLSTTQEAACAAWASAYGWTVTINSGSQCYAKQTSTSSQTQISFVSVASDCADPNTCGLQTGSKVTQNFTQGYARSPDLGAIDWVGPLNDPYFDGTNQKTYCMSKCVMKPDNVVSGYRSQVPASNGLYRMSVDLEFVVQGSPGQNGSTCTPGTLSSLTPVDKSDTPAPCPGVLGTVNGKPYCAPAGNTALPAAQGTPVPGQTVAGNPSAGQVPTSGEGSGTGGAGRTPSTGDGGPMGGPAGAASGAASSAAGYNGSTGRVPTRGDGTEQAACGAPGQPVCSVKVDETGTPTAPAPSMNAAQADAAIKKSGDDLIAEINKPRAGTAWSWTFQLPTGCQPLTLSAFSISGGPLVLDVCQFRPQIHDLMSMVWVLVTISALMGMLSRAVNQGGN